MRQVFKCSRPREYGAEGMLAGLSKFQARICLLMTCLMIIPSAAGQYSDIAYLDATNAASATGSQAVDINPNGTYLASAYDGLVAIHDVETLELITSFSVENDVLDVEFSPDGQFLAFSRSGNSADIDTIQVIDLHTMERTTKQHGSNSQPAMIQWSPDANMLAVPNSNNGIDLIRIADMEIEKTLNGEHNARVTCIGFSSLGSYILTGDEAGRLVMWTSQGHPTDKEWNLNSKIQSCSFDSVDERFAVLTENGELSTWSFAGGLVSEVTFDGGAASHWSSDNKVIHVLENGNSPRILTVNSTNLDASVSIYLAHKALDFTVRENTYATRDMAFVATNTGHIAVYGTMPIPAGYGENGADLDGDQIPDIFDNDDDGDAILDENDKLCAGIEQMCSKSPNTDTIRSVEISVDRDTFKIEDTYTLDSQTSSALRNLSRGSLIGDIKLSQEEADFLAQTVCKNMNQNHFISSWKNVILLSSGQLQDGEVECQIESGMVLTAKNDQTTHVAFTYVLTFNLSENMAYPFEFTLQSQPTATDASLAQHAQMHPIDVSAHSTDSQSEHWSPWWVIEGELSFTLEEEIEPKPSVSEKISEILISYPILFVPILGLLVVGIVFIIRIQNSIDMDLDDEHHPNGKEEVGDESEEPYEEPVVQDEPINQAPAKPRRKAKQSPLGTDGPITKVKRKRLDSVVSEPKRVSRKKTVSKKKVVSKAQKSEVVKTRRVVTYSDDEE